MKKKWLLLLLSVAFSFVVCEFVVRVAYKITPGVHTYSPWFHEVDTLVSLRGFFSDEHGIFKADSASAKYLKEYLAGNKVSANRPVDAELQAYGLDIHYENLQKSTNTGPFDDYINNLQKKDTLALDAFSKAVIRYCYSPINKDGFRSIDFACCANDTNRKKILLLGDSFTWGHSADNITNSFADILLTKDYIVYNTGISGADPAQYLAVAQKYIPVLQPDYVVVNFYMGNDVQYYKRVPRAGMPIHYSCNASNLIACPNGIYFENAQEAYRFVKAHYRIPPVSILSRFCSQTAIGTLFWRVLQQNGLVTSTPNEYLSYWKATEQYKSELPVCNEELNAINNICKSEGAKFILIAIPDLVDKQLKFANSVPHLFGNLGYYNAPVNSSHYKHTDGHYNEEGHKQHALFIDSLIKAD
jgi:hypothetical protein